MTGPPERNSKVRRGDGYGQLLLLANAIFECSGVQINRGHKVAKREISELRSLRIGSSRTGGDPDFLLHVSYEICKREIAQAELEQDLKNFQRSLFSVISLLRASAENKHPKRLSSAARSMAKSLIVELEPPIPAWITNYVRNTRRFPQASDIRTLTGFGSNAWAKFLDDINQTVVTLKIPMVDRIVPPDSKPLAFNVAEMLSEIAGEEHGTQKALPTYDESDSKIRLVQVSVSGFRGSKGNLSVDLVRNGKPVDVLLWGDNAVGKSTVVDGIEFALQGRIDRSADFNSTLRSSARNLSAETTSSVVKLNDSTIVERAIVSNEAGRDVASHDHVRPGFRIAPVVIRRSDILRFLDTDTLSRGTVFFDYFPDPQGELAQRPDEELRMLEEERFVLRVTRDDLGRKLVTKFPDAGVDFGNSAQLEEFASIHVAGSDASKLGSIENLDGEQKTLISSMRSVQHRLSAIKKKLDKGIETLNPVAYRSQLDRIVPVLGSVTTDLTKSFQRIAGAEHITAIRVLVAKSGPVSLDIVIDFENKKSAFPQQAFSEGYKDLIALLFFLSVTKKAAELGQARVLILDDVLQSVDASIRIEVIDYVLEEFKDWQLIITGHDRAWLNQLRALFNYRGRTVIEQRINRWSFGEGIEVSDAVWNIVKSLRDALSRNDEILTAAAVGLLLEQVSQELSWRLEVRMVRRKDDRYTLADLWSGTSSRLRKTSLKSIVEGIDKRLSIRNLLGAHYNDWAASIPWSDIERLASDVLAVHEAVHCQACSDWVSKYSTTEFRCKCESLRLSV